MFEKMSLILGFVARHPGGSTMRIEVIINGERWTEHGYTEISRKAIIEVPMDEYRVNEPGLTVELVKAGFPEGDASKAAIAVACGDWYTSGDLAVRW